MSRCKNSKASTRQASYSLPAGRHQVNQQPPAARLSRLLVALLNGNSVSLAAIDAMATLG